jgi:TolA-binding protein
MYFSSMMMNKLMSFNKKYIYNQFKTIITIQIVVSCLVLFSLNCTAYFNTYYNAEKAFEEGQDNHKKLLQDHPDSLVVTPPADVIAKYDRSIEKAQKTIETFPKKKKWHDDALFLIGRSYFFKKEMEKSISCMRQLEKEFPSSQFVPEAQIYIAKAYIENDNLDKAEEVLVNAEHRFPELNKNQEISLLMITIALRRNGKSQAITLLEEAIKTTHSDNVRLDLFLRTAELYIDLKQYTKAIQLLKKAPRKKDLPTHSYRIDRALLICYTSIDSLSLANDLITAMIANKNYSPFMDEMLYQKGMILYSLGEVEDAIKVFKKLSSGVDSNSILSDTSTFKAKALFELAIIYQKQKEDYEKSYHYLKLTAASRDTSTNSLAKKRLSAMDRLKKLRDKSEIVDSISGSNQFAIGEIFKFELDEPDSAFNQFLQIAMDSTTDTGFIPKALLQAAIIARDELGNKQKSDSIFNVIVTSYPATEYAKTAQRESGMLVTVVTRQDSAAELYNKAERLFYSENDVKGSIQLFFDIFKIYPELPIAPKSLFAAAWFSNTVLLKNRTAKMLYEKICEKYPESIYCTQQAKPRIKAVVDTLAKLDQLRRENEKKQQGKDKKTGPSPKKSVQNATGHNVDETLTEDPGEDDLSVIDNEKDTTTKSNVVPAKQPVPNNENTPKVNSDTTSSDTK